MADVELVIKIDEKLYNYMQTEVYNPYLDKRFDYAIRFAVRDGKPLPKRHGRLIDISEYEDNYYNVTIAYDDGDHIYEKYTRIELPTVVEADKESEDKE